MSHIHVKNEAGYKTPTDPDFSTARNCHVAVLSSKDWTLADGWFFLLKLVSLASIKDLNI